MTLPTPLELLTARLPERLRPWARCFLAMELIYGMDAFLLAAIVDRESLGGTSKHLTVKGPAGKGDFGNGHGLAQIDGRHHRSFIEAKFDDARPLWTIPAFNILYAAELFARNLKLLGGDLQAAVASYNCGVGGARKALAKLNDAELMSPWRRQVALDGATTGNDYVTDVLHRRENFVNNKVEVS